MSLSDQQHISHNVMYDPLPDRTSFRLLQLLPGGVEDPIRWNLQTCQLGNKLEIPDYEALSYVWNLWTDTSQVVCNDQNITVTTNLADALFRLRLESEMRILWVDAICINQMDLKEREHQVRLMGQIFSSASRVLIWLGRDELNMAETACELICATIIRDYGDIQTRYEQSTEGPSDLKSDSGWSARPAASRQEKPITRSPSHVNAESSNGRLPPSMEPLYFRGNSSLPVYFEKDEPAPLFQTDQWDALRILWSNPYFQRTWIIQEIVLATNALVLWGNIAIYWECIEKATLILTNPFLGDWFERYTYNVFILSDLMRFSCAPPDEQAKELNIVSLLLRTRSFKASDPRDKIYGLLALAQKSSNFGANSPTELFVEPDYTVSTAQVYTSAAKKLLKESYWVNILLSVCHDHELHDYDETPRLILPSWVPDWSRVPRAKPFEYFHHSSHHGRPTAVQQPIFTSEGYLCLAGVQVARIRNVLPVCGSKAHGYTKTLDETILSVIDECLKQGVSVSTLCDTLTSEMLVVEYVFLNIDGPDVSDLSRAREMAVEDFAAFIKAGVGESRYQELVLRYGLESSPDKYCEAFNRTAVMWCDGRRVFFMEDGTIGLGPAEAREDDVICFFDGSSFPFVLRKEGSRYRFIGACYIAELGQNDEESRPFWIV